MSDKLDALLERMALLEKEMLRELWKKELEFFYEVRLGNIRFKEEARRNQRKLVKRWTSYIRDPRFMTVLTTPVIWACLVPVVFLDLVMMIYQSLCFPGYGIPKVRRRNYSLLDWHLLDDLN